MKNPYNPSMAFVSIDEKEKRRQSRLRKEAERNVKEASVSRVYLKDDVFGLALISEKRTAGLWKYVNPEGMPAMRPDFETHPTYVGITESVIDGQDMVEIPAFYCKVDTIKDGPYKGKTAWFLSPTPKDGYSLHSAFYWGGSPINQFWFGKYQASLDGGKLCSVPGVMPAVSRTSVQFSADAEARNVGGVAGFMQNSYHQNSAIHWLYLLEHATMDSQGKTGRGRVDTISAAMVDAPDVAQATYRGMVGLWGNVYRWSVGMQIEDGRIWVWDENQQLVDTGHTIPILVAAWRYPKTFVTGSGTGFNLAHGFLTATGQATLEGATCQDGRYFTDGTTRVLRIGGQWNTASSAGLWCAIGNHDASSASASVGSRLAKV